MNKEALLKEALELAKGIIDNCQGDAWERECTEKDRVRFNEIYETLNPEEVVKPKIKQAPQETTYCFICNREFKTKEAKRDHYLGKPKKHSERAEAIAARTLECPEGVCVRCGVPVMDMELHLVKSRSCRKIYKELLYSALVEIPKVTTAEELATHLRKIREGFTNYLKGPELVLSHYKDWITPSIGVDSDLLKKQILKKALKIYTLEEVL